MFVFRDTPIVFGGNGSHKLKRKKEAKCIQPFIKIIFRLISLPQQNNVVTIMLMNSIGISDMQEKCTIKIYFL